MVTATSRPLTLLALASTLAACQGPRPAPPLVIVNTAVIDGTGAPVRQGVTIVIRDGRIAALSPAGATRPPRGAVVIDGAARYVLPGLVDMHVHFGTGGLGAGDSLAEDRVLRQFLFYGVTTVLNAGASHGSVEEIRQRRQGPAGGTAPAPHLYATGGLLTVPGSHPIGTIMRLPEGADAATYDWSSRGVWVVRTPAEVREVVARLAAAGMDAVKLVVESGPGVFGDHRPQMPPALIAAAVDAARGHGLRVLAHATSPDELTDAVEAGVSAVMHLVGPEPVDPALLAAMQERGIYYVPTLSLFVWADAWGDPAAVLTDPFLRSGVEEGVITSLLRSSLAPTAPPSDQDWAWRRRMLQALMTAHEAGVSIVAGTDTGNPFVFPGYSMHHELALMVEAGFTPMEAIEAATRRAAEMLGRGGEFGTVEVGKLADLLILGANPLEDIRNTRTLEVVVRGGTVIDRASLLADR